MREIVDRQDARRDDVAPLRPLRAEEVGAYVAFRLKVAGAGDEALFADAAILELARRSGGIPRLINIIAHKSMMLAFGEGAATIGKPHVSLASDDTAAIANAPGRASWLERLRSLGASRIES